jgi:hypothetical protein
MLRGLLVITLFLGCAVSASPPRPPPDAAFYYWRTTFKLSASERATLAALHVTRLYVRAFDVGWGDAGLELLGELQVIEPPPAGIEVVPVVFVRAEVFRKLRSTQPLAERVHGAVADRMRALGRELHELQLDCDWTDTTQRAYFGFLRQLRAADSAITLSATIRLHQVKYRERTGVPPVDRGMLMFYNMGEFSADPEARAIFDADAAAKYTARIADYPLPLDAALPIWSWTVHVRDERVIGLMQATDPDELPKLDFLARRADDRFVATRTAFLHGTLLREGDLLKVEVMRREDTLAAARQLAPHLAASHRTVTLFDLSERNLARHDASSLAQAIATLR